MKFSDFLDFKSLSKELRILKVRKSESGCNINWTNMVEVMVKKSSPETIFFKTSHLTPTYDCIKLVRNTRSSRDMEVTSLNKKPVKITNTKYKDLMSLCTGKTPVVRLPEYQEFFKNLPHDNN